MLILPAIDLRQGRCVRLLQGREQDETVYDHDPAAVAERFVAAGAQRLHLVDLDGAFRGQGANLASIQEIVRRTRIPVQVGGGLRTREDVRRMLDLGVASVIIGTMAVKHPQELETALQEQSGEPLILGIDSRNRKIAVEGWQEDTELDDTEFALHWKERGVQRVVFTDIARDGMLTGPNLDALRDMAQRTGLKVTASGGVSSAEDLLQLQKLEADGVDQVIVGKAIYEGRIDLAEVLSC
ncbi:MAG TPA: 1-(5-phosphoribosyl)-5-[(5-phosphoribosylamino)methylideneamino]imidazole-4-carboxamide isomerase [Deltaproteobacteria bacterium]|jgi:phosphoribosylformimino-5-aminoimidazole carboxamide ribotide isomerase|nr:1-(5-phosphoribosyl)-5-[(5-phosphoribosylamino)methylideneamino]imidazole-4-carboxamide isomerase [SAR324 cluster bacterium]HIF67730.1 1-(5-phosphoribosyl)-5-[(5-phosphoribosylamino)methylideneamino]imidazole-4-carboxamide isomerase [Candidatus Lambdaproteobacteria bacterium]HIL16985.1 1-(5-phosphoribosyl)-5-[(5-phosphoribosylamino)methylideneamino]imidazole-4-carboxamide isomerase [Deltaproteobacteria bacterium]|tara:strand:+ start:259 stop:978 length:720 start_codon:yes stop_codon:yes gene_type:complete